MDHETFADAVLRDDTEEFLQGDLKARLNVIAIDEFLGHAVKLTADQALTRIVELEDQKAVSIELLEREVARLQAHNQHLVEANNQYLERARTAEARVREFEAQQQAQKSSGPAEQPQQGVQELAPGVFLVPLGDPGALHGFLNGAFPDDFFGRKPS